jgi:hypothetical protein
MAVAPLNKFITIAVPVAPGEQTVYTAPTGVSSIVLYASVSNVALKRDSVVIQGVQSGVVSISTVQYDNTTGITTVETATPHGFNVNDEVTMSGIAFTCGSYTGGLTTSIFPDPQKSFIVDSITGPVGTSLTFTTDTGVVSGIAHTYVSGGQAAPLQMEFIMSILENSTT